MATSYAANYINITKRQPAPSPPARGSEEAL